MTILAFKCLRSLVNRELAQIVTCMALKSEALGSTSTWGNTLLSLDFFATKTTVEKTPSLIIPDINISLHVLRYS